MNTPVRRLATIAALMFLALMVAATSVQFVQAPSLNADGRNVRTIYREFGQDRGPIIVAGESIASSTPVDTSYRYQRSYAVPHLYAHSTGYFAAALSSMTGMERAANEVLGGTADSLVVQRLQDLITGRQPQGGSVELTLDPAAQQAAWDALGDARGAVVALDTRTGAILAMVSKPSFDPNALAVHSAEEAQEAQEAYDALLADPTDPLVNRAIAGDLYAPGSSFKVVVAAAAIEQQGLEADSPVPSPAQLQLPLSTQVVNNPGGIACTAEDTAPLRYTMEQSCNTTFAQLGMDLGAEAIAEQAEAFGFGQPLQIPLDVTASRYPEEADAARTAMSALGQVDVRVTPLQMAMVSQAIANGGEQMRPYLVATERNADLEVVSTTEPTVLRESVSPETADVLTELMTSVVENGTGRAAQLPGIAVAGKTGTAQSGSDAPPHAWFTSFAPADDPRVAVAVVVENGGIEGDIASGGTTAAPIARQVLAALLAD
ncbi:peptidoglycan D,D-transpeptidase FtsI family protein [Georgenia sp. H159]|uniref:peptidoglycan D,D-transpeptidase FtsI family protein n=1 Tax=Georgenia sp. H159 TaxID=3076115 RepID=UPI002D77AB0F|nr:penicillin-binding transpeptidase domain-containing protein [Georgenia sp. H159]